MSTYNKRNGDDDDDDEARFPFKRTHRTQRKRLRCMRLNGNRA